MLHSEFKKQFEQIQQLTKVRNIYRIQQSKSRIEELRQDILQSLSIYDMEVSLPTSCFEFTVSLNYLDIHISTYTLSSMVDMICNCDLGYSGDVIFSELNRWGDMVDDEVINEEGDHYVVRIENFFQ